MVMKHYFGYIEYFDYAGSYNVIVSVTLWMVESDFTSLYISSATKANSVVNSQESIVINTNIKKEVIPMPIKDGKGPKGQGPKDGHGEGKGKGTSKPDDPKKGGKKGGC